MPESVADEEIIDGPTPKRMRISEQNDNGSSTDFDMSIAEIEVFG